VLGVQGDVGAGREVDQSINPSKGTSAWVCGRLPSCTRAVSWSASSGIALAGAATMG
jgi:hypothetical protein